jgi:hypothetical protein
MAVCAMTKSESAAAELAYLLARTRLIVDAVEKAEPSPTIAALRGVVEATAVKGDLRGMRSIRNDLLDMSRALAPDVQAALKAALDAQAADDPFRGAAG